MRFWNIGGRWFTFVSGQDCSAGGHGTLREALQSAYEFIDTDNSRLRPGSSSPSNTLPPVPAMPEIRNPVQSDSDNRETRIEERASVVSAR